MERTALVTGASERVAEVGGALRQAAFTVVGVDDAAKVAEVCAGLEPGSVDCYVQLPTDLPLRGGSVVDRVRNFLTDGLLARFDHASAALPALRPDGTVLLVAGNHPPASGAPDNHAARLALLEVLAGALLSQYGGQGMHAVVAGHRETTADLVALAEDPGRDQLQVVATALEDVPAWDFADWRNELMTLNRTQA